MLVLESYKSLDLDLEEVAMVPVSESFDLPRHSSEWTDRDETRNLRRNAPADQLMYAWSINVSDEHKEEAQASHPLETCPPEVYLG